ncbi:MAG: 2OG-Fe(II) oxygenase [Hyphomicrobiaceae bacterium]|nr:2OG-Fe(II) oxygenase [Hyphomicrobiaceae bacterium]
MVQLNIDLLKKAELRTDPFEYTIVPGFLPPESLDEVVSDYPALKGGSYPLDSVDVPPGVQALIDQMDGPAFETAIAEKFGVALDGQPKMYSLRGYCRGTDGKIHTDSKDKIITVLLYLNKDWTHDGGKLRMLRSGTNLDDFAEEVPPDNGTLLVFRRSERSWHGHGPFEGKRCSIQMNWMTSEGARGFHKLRHSISARVKKIMAAE